MAKQLAFEEDARRRLKVGVDILAEAVADRHPRWRYGSQRN
jgi:hypothetical protein